MVCLRAHLLRHWPVLPRFLETRPNKWRRRPWLLVVLSLQNRRVILEKCLRVSIMALAYKGIGLGIFSGLNLVSIRDTIIRVQDYGLDNRHGGNMLVAAAVSLLWPVAVPYLAYRHHNSRVRQFRVGSDIYTYSAGDYRWILHGLRPRHTNGAVHDWDRREIDYLCARGLVKMAEKPTS